MHCSKELRLKGIPRTTQQDAGCREARARFDDSVLLGVHREATGVHANPPDSFQLREDDTLFALAYDQSQFKASKVRLGQHACSPHPRR